jgi:aspartyl-tRNA(Asn)/glutamyl-tRNA(Gln) amidotransferase subunit A
MELEEYAGQDGVGLAALVRDGEVSAAELEDAARRAIAAVEPSIQATVGELYDSAFEASSEGPFAGLPMLMKDVAPHLEGQIVQAGSRWTGDGIRCPADTHLGRRIRAAGFRVIGRTRSPEFAFNATTEPIAHGPTRNPWDLERTPGGSSGGSAAAVAAGLVPGATASDGGGSIRIPAAFTGCFGLKPTRARVAAFPASPLGTMAHAGPLTRTVADAALMLTVIAAPDARDPYAWISPPPDFRDGLDNGVRGLRIAYSPRLGYVQRVHPEVEGAVAAAAKTFESLGAGVEEADPDMGGDPIAVWNTFWWPAMHYQLQAYGDRWRELSDPGLVAAASRSHAVPVAEYLRAQLQRVELHNAFARFHERYDLLLTPSLPLPAFEVGELVPRSGEWGSQWTDWSPFSYPFNLTTQPAASVPCGLTEAGLPVGLQIVGPIGADALVLRAARAFEAARPFPTLDAPRGPQA